MPIYAYRCAECGHSKDVLQKLSDPVLTTCPACGAEAFSKQVTAAGFQLKGSGWYVTDFKGGAKPSPAAKSEDGAGGGKAGGGDSGSGTAGSDSGSGTSSGSGSGSDSGSSSGGSDGGSPAASASAGGCGGGCACH